MTIHQNHKWEYVCVTCGAPFANYCNSRPSSRCPACQVEHRKVQAREYQRAKYLAARVVNAETPPVVKTQNAEKAFCTANCKSWKWCKIWVYRGAALPCMPGCEAIRDCRADMHAPAISSNFGLVTWR